MITRFRTLFTLQIVHEYYGGACSDFQIVIPDDTAQLLRGGNLLVKELDGIHHVLFEAGESDAPVASLAGKRLRFGLKLVNPYFTNFTSLPGEAASALRLYINQEEYGRFHLRELASLVGASLLHRITLAARPLQVTVMNREKTWSRTREITDAGETEVRFDLGGLPPGVITVEESSGDAVESVSYYLDPELLRTRMYGIIEIDIDERMYTLGPPEFEIAFTARQEILSYHVTARNYTEAEFEGLAIVDTGYEDDGRDPVVFAAEELPESNNPADRIVIFRSQDRVMRRSRGRKRIQLLKNGEEVLANLPQPGPEMAGANMFIHIAKP